MRKKKDNIVRYTLAELKRMPSQTDWARVAATTQAEIEAQIAEDPDDWIADAGGVLIRGIPPRPSKGRVNIRLDQEVLDFFRAGGRGYQTRINEVLKVFVRKGRARIGSGSPGANPVAREPAASPQRRSRKG